MNEMLLQTQHRFCRAFLFNMKKEVICGIYKITSPTGKIYIGESKNINNRKNGYKNSGCKAQPRLNYSINKYGWDKHVFEIIEECDILDLKCKERYWQDFYDVTGKNGLNCTLTKCGDEKQIHSKETINKISAKAKERYQDDNFSAKMSRLFKEKGISKGDKNPRSKYVINFKTLEQLTCVLTLSEILAINYTTLIAMLGGYNTNTTDWCFLEDYLNSNYISNLRCNSQKYIYKGIDFDKRKGKWQYRVFIEGKRFRIQAINSREEALKIKNLTLDNIDKFENADQFRKLIRELI